MPNDKRTTDARVTAEREVDAVMRRIAGRIQRARARSDADAMRVAEAVFLESARFAMRWLEPDETAR